MSEEKTKKDTKPETVQHTAAHEKDNWETVFVAPGSGKDRGTIFVGVNGKGYYVPRGKSVAVPPEVAEVLRNREAQLEQAEAYSDSVSNEN